ncbi:hypothetical protein [Pseudonocardia lacus]|uniref:hypothetical protein n=1 Tax=Pseudonocardia lacus TaxID=2835865 RepID=UPI001BDD212F|nr:hypothetical protein [Pseudonocardia lacus]
MNIQDRLRAGVTVPRPDPAARAAWLAAVHEYTRIDGGTVTTAAEEPTVGRNYHRVGVQLRNGMPLAFLLNPAAGLVAAAQPAGPHDILPVFAAVPHREVFSRRGFEVAAPADLDQPLTEAHLRSLTEDELQDVAYHRPERLGDLLFNWFD